MLSLFTFVSPSSDCSYLPDRESQFHYEVVGELSLAEYQQRMQQGWRRFGHTLFRPICSGCTQCQSLRVDVQRFRPSATQKRVRKLNQGPVQLRIGTPEVTAEKLALYDKFHAGQTRKGWPVQEPESECDYIDTFVHNPFPTEEWCYFLDGQLVGVGYVDRLDRGLSAIYFYHDPDQQRRSLGVWNVLSVIEQARILGLPHVYMGYFVEGCRSLEYKQKFRPNEVLNVLGEWESFIE